MGEGTGGGADMRLMSLPFPFGGDILFPYFAIDGRRSLQEVQPHCNASNNLWQSHFSQGDTFLLNSYARLSCRVLITGFYSVP